MGIIKCGITGVQSRGAAVHALIVHCHPELESFNRALTEVAGATLREQGFSVDVSDLYNQDFDPCERAEHYVNRDDSAVFSPLREQRHASETNTLPEDVQREIARLKRADLVLFQFPIWWHGQPAILKGWFDRVFVNGSLYTSAMRYDRGYFRCRRAVCSVTTGAPEFAFGPGSRGGDIERILWSTHYSLHYMGFDVLPPFVAFGIQGHGYTYLDDEENDRHLNVIRETWKERLKTLDRDKALRFLGWGDWDQDGRSKTGKPGRLTERSFRV
ncbi:MAG: NAD(P)H-dependent oxidoreductase [Paracoccaceae bacterium]|nr:NAD(P)H-dependent oxidoreductase [Paracoccaceae bacterium]